MLNSNLNLNILEQPWTLLAVGILAELFVLIAARFYPLKFTRKHLLVGPAVIALAFAVDYLVVTDREKIETIMDTLVKATEEEHAEDVIRFISPDYSDSYHRSPEHFNAFCRQLLSEPQIEKNYVTNQKLDLAGVKATVLIAAISRLDPGNKWSAGIGAVKTAWRLEFSRQPDKSWLIHNIEFIELDDQQVDWTASK